MSGLTRGALRWQFDGSDRVEPPCAFIKLSGFEKLRSAFERLGSERGRPLRVLTMTCMGADPCNFAAYRLGEAGQFKKLVRALSADGRLG